MLSNALVTSNRFQHFVVASPSARGLSEGTIRESPISKDRSARISPRQVVSHPSVSLALDSASIRHLWSCESHAYAYTLLVDLGEDLRVLEELVLLEKSVSSPGLLLTSSPTLMGLPPHPGSRTRSPALTLVGTTLPSLPGAPGPTAMTVASGRGVWVAAEGRKRPEAVFCAGVSECST